MASLDLVGAVMSDNLPQRPGSKRRRVAKACLSCRYRKSKCDGQRPVCTRCRDYEHTCTWSDDKTDRSSGKSVRNHGPSSVSPDRLQSASGSETTSSYHLAIQSYDDLLGRLQQSLSDSDRAVVEKTLSSIRRLLPGGSGSVSHDQTSNTSPLAAVINQISPHKHSTARQRYLGEASEIRFYQSVKQVLEDQIMSDTSPENDIYSYDQEDSYSGREKPAKSDPNPPAKHRADKYVDIYFTTIHIAYPFICKPLFMDQYEKYWNGSLESKKAILFAPLLYTVLALGAYYTSFLRSENDGPQIYLQYFERASSLAAPALTDCTLENIQTLLVQCIFLLATSQTDRCWTLLGLAVRIAQMMGLHVEDSYSRSSADLSLSEVETMRRTWYTMYNLDRLLALQLGRPVGVHEEDYFVLLPSRAEDSHLGINRKEHSYPPLSNDSPSAVDFFLCVIRFSGLLGKVISNLYIPSQLKPDPDTMLANITALDGSLLEWKQSLPRHLRFDLGHAFENSITFKRQRNMLAIKFHHLRSLIHRPYLCLSRLQQDNAPLMDLLSRVPDRVNYMERTCVFEAQQTARLLHNVSDTGSLIHDFPWWQMISCLLCASSILLVAGAYIEPDQIAAGLHSEELKDDAETCLKAFDALSVNSGAARRARDMLESLKTAHVRYQESLSSISPSASTRQNQAGEASTAQMTEYPSRNIPEQPFVWDMGSETLDWQQWPFELTDTMMWSAQFLDPGLNHKSQAAPTVPLGDFDEQMGKDLQSGVA